MPEYTFYRPPVGGIPYTYAIAFAFGFAITLLALQATKDGPETLMQ